MRPLPLVGISPAFHTGGMADDGPRTVSAAALMVPAWRSITGSKAVAGECLEQRIDRGGAPRCVRMGPPILAEPLACVLLCTLS